jgi:hypothetical protein
VRDPDLALVEAAGGKPAERGTIRALETTMPKTKKKKNQRAHRELVRVAALEDAREEAVERAAMDARARAFIEANPNADPSDPRVLSAMLGLDDDEADSILDELADAGALPRAAPRTRPMIPPSESVAIAPGEI